MRLEQTRRKIESLLDEGRVSRRDVEYIYGAIFLSAMTAFEGMLENLFFGLLARRYSLPTDVRPRARFTSPRAVRSAVLQDQKYLNWFPFDQTERRAKAFFNRGLPFRRLSLQEKKLLQQTLYIRNAFAHQSRHAIKVFKEQVIARTPLLPREKTPSGFLRSVAATAPVQTRYEQLILELAAMATKICG